MTSITVVLVISPRDNVATALEALTPGQTVVAGCVRLPIVEPVPRGHKVALREIAAGDAVIKYGSPIGLAAARIAAGTHVHTHNVASVRGRGDLARGAPSEARIAEPPDTDMPELPERQQP